MFEESLHNLRNNLVCLAKILKYDLLPLAENEEIKKEVIDRLQEIQKIISNEESEEVCKSCYFRKRSFRND